MGSNLHCREFYNPTKSTNNGELEINASLNIVYVPSSPYNVISPQTLIT